MVAYPVAAITGYTSQDLVESWHVPGRPLGKIPGTQSLFTGKPLDEFAETVTFEFYSEILTFRFLENQQTIFAILQRNYKCISSFLLWSRFRDLRVRTPMLPSSHPTHSSITILVCCARRRENSLHITGMPTGMRS